MGGKQAKHTLEEVWAERKKFLTMSTDDRRRHYSCGSQFTPYNAIPTWTERSIHSANTQERTTHRYPIDDEINGKVSVWKGDISRLEVDAIVNSACDPVKAKGAVNRALYESGGQFYQDECLHKGLPDAGLVKVTGGYVIPAKYVVHTVPPKTKSADVLIECYQNSLEAALGHGIKTIAFPCLATNKFLGFSKEKGAHIALSTVRNWLEQNKTEVERVIFCVYTDGDLQVYDRLLHLYFPLNNHPTAEDSDSDNEGVGQLRDLLIAHHMIRILHGTRPAQRALSDGAQAASSSFSIRQWQDQTCHPLFQPIRLDRSTDVPLIKTLHAVYTHPDMELRKRPLIQFSGEEGLDLGALSREYFYKNLEYLTQGQIINSPAFEGVAGCRLPCASRVHLRSGVYELTGKVLAHSILHDGVGLVGLSPAISFLLSHRVKREEVDYSGIPLNVDDIADLELQTLLKKTDVMDSLSTSERQTVQQDLLEAMERCNYGYNPINADTLPVIKQELVLYEVIFKRWDQIEQMRHGLECLGLYSFLCENPCDANVKHVFPGPDDVEILPEMIQAKLNPNRSDSVHYCYFIRLLQDIHKGGLDDTALRDLVAFWTGHPALPEGELHVVTNGEAKYPVANCCFFKLELPGATATYEEFRDCFFTALSAGATGFNRA